MKPPSASADQVGSIDQITGDAGTVRDSASSIGSSIAESTSEALGSIAGSISPLRNLAEGIAGG